MDKFFTVVEASEKSDSLRLSSEITADVNAKECQICWEDAVQDYQLKCKHSFCKICIVCWACNNLSCPICRFALANDEGLKVLVSERIMLHDIHEACRRGDFDVINFLIKNDANWKTFDRSGITPLQVAFNSNRLDVFEYLIQNGANIDYLNKDEISLLYHECYKGNLEKIQYLLERNADPNITDESGFSPLLRACARRFNTELITLLLDWEADLNVRSKNGDTPLRLACQSNNLDTIKLLVNRGANLNNESELMNIAENRGYKEIFKYLIDKKVI